jgi:hypothetical protein
MVNFNPDIVPKLVPTIKKKTCIFQMQVTTIPMLPIIISSNFTIKKEIKKYIS